MQRIDPAELDTAYPYITLKDGTLLQDKPEPAEAPQPEDLPNQE